MSVRVMTMVWDHSTASGSELLLLLAIADHAHDDGTGAWPSISTLAQKVRLSERNTQKLISKLRERGELRVRPNTGPNRVNQYVVEVANLKGEPGDTLSRTTPSVQESRVQTVNSSSPRHQRHPVTDDTVEGVTQDAEGVTQFTLGVSPVTPKPSLNHQEPSVEPSSPRFPDTPPVLAPPRRPGEISEDEVLRTLKASVHPGVVERDDGAIVTLWRNLITIHGAGAVEKARMDCMRAKEKPYPENLQKYLPKRDAPPPPDPILELAKRNLERRKAMAASA